MHRIDRTATETLVSYLNSKFPDRRKARARFTRYHTTHHAQAVGRTMRFCQMPKVWVVLHEFAHVLDHRIHRHLTCGHSESFYRNLLRVIDATGAARAEYPWDKEYRQVLRWAKRDGYTGEAESLLAGLSEQQK